MPFLKRACPVTRYRLLEQPTKEQLGHITEHLARKGFRSIDTLPDELAAGWVNFDDPTDSEWRTSSPDRLAHVVFTLRQDKRTVPAKLLDVRTRLEVKKFLERRREELMEKVLIPFANKDEKAEIRERVRLSLLSQAAPVPAMADVIWITPSDPRTAEVWLCTTTQALRDKFSFTFGQTFDRLVRPITPWTPHPDEAEPWPMDVGQRFLTWLYGHNGHSLMVTGRDMAVTFDRVTVADDATKISVLPEMEAARLEELQKAIENGLLATECDLTLGINGDLYKVRVRGTDFSMRVETPFWSYDREDPDGSFADKVLSLDAFFSLWDKLYNLWLREQKYLPEPDASAETKTSRRQSPLPNIETVTKSLNGSIDLCLKGGTRVNLKFVGPKKDGVA